MEQVIHTLQVQNPVFREYARFGISLFLSLLNRQEIYYAEHRFIIKHIKTCGITNPDQTDNMKKRPFIITLISMIFMLSAFQLVDDILSRLSLNSITAQRYILCNFVGDFSNPGEIPEDHGSVNSAAISAEKQMEFFQIPRISKLSAINKIKEKLFYFYILR